MDLSLTQGGSYRDGSRPGWISELMLSKIHSEFRAFSDCFQLCARKPSAPQTNSFACKQVVIVCQLSPVVQKRPPVCGWLPTGGRSCQSGFQLSYLPNDSGVHRGCKKCNARQETKSNSICLTFAHSPLGLTSRTRKEEQQSAPRGSLSGF
jgi:hypothetical protein